jgi:hypothetical protein
VATVERAREEATKKAQQQQVSGRKVQLVVIHTYNEWAQSAASRDPHIHTGTNIVSSLFLPLSTHVASTLSTLDHPIYQRTASS